MENVIQAIEKRKKYLTKIDYCCCCLFILTGIVGCSVIESGGAIWVCSFVIIGFVIDYFMTKYINDGGPLTTRRLTDDDLEGLKKKDLERLRLHIYAKHGYNFNVNDGLYFLDKIAEQHFPNYLSINNLSDLDELCRKTGYDRFDISASYLYRLYSWKRIDEMSEKEKDEIRKKIEKSNHSYFDDFTSTYNTFTLKIGQFNREGKSGHEGVHYYEFQDCDWYKPTTCNVEEVW